jgi:hypothetical protein
LNDTPSRITLEDHVISSEPYGGEVIVEYHAATRVLLQDGICELSISLRGRCSPCLGDSSVLIVTLPYKSNHTLAMSNSSSCLSKAGATSSRTPIEIEARGSSNFAIQILSILPFDHPYLFVLTTTPSQFHPPIPIHSTSTNPFPFHSPQANPPLILLSRRHLYLPCGKNGI